MDNLKDYSEITDLNFDGENPHLAICHKSQGYSANKRPTALLFKSEGASLNQDIMKSLDGVVKQEIIQKMSYDNKRKALQEAVEEKLRSDMSANGEYVYAYVMDFNEDLVAFRYQDDIFAVSYTVTEDGVVTLGEEPRSAKLRDLFVDSDTGEELIKASDWLSRSVADEDDSEQQDIPDTDVDGEDKETGEDSIDSPEKLQQEEEETMSDKKDPVVQEQEGLIKSADVQELIKQAIADDRKEQEELRKSQELEATTTELFKGFTFVEEGVVSDLVKAVVSNEQAIEITKALSAAQDKIDTLVKSEKEAQDELVKVKEEFGKPDAIEGEAKDKGVQAPSNREDALMKAVQASLAAKKQ